MEGLPVTVFDRFDWDGATAACMSRVCRAWYHNIRRVSRFAKYIDLHYVRVDHAQLLLHQIDTQTEYLVQIDAVVALRKIEYIFSLHHINLNKIPGFGYILSELDALGYRGEDIKFILNNRNGDIVIINNFYDDDNVDNIKPPMLSILEKEILPGTFSWKYIRFPYDNIVHCLRPGLWFHRGASFCVHFKAHGNRRILYDDITKDVVALRRKRNHEPLTEAERNFIEKRKRNNPVPLDLL